MATSGAAASPSRPPLVGRVLPWLRPSLTSRNVKTFIRCLVVLLAALVLLLDTAALNAMGQAAFFASLLVIMLSPNMPASLFFFAAVTILLGMLLGWAWGAMSMAAGQAARDKTLLAARYQAAQQEIVAGPPGLTVTALVFDGFFLDMRTSATFGGLFFVGCFAMGAVRAHAPKLTLLSIFASIVLDVMMSYGPLFPSTQYMLASIFLKPTAAYVGIALAGVFLIFPESLSHVWLSGYSHGVLSTSLGLLAAQDELLHLPHPLTVESAQPLYIRTRKLRQALVETSQTLQGTTGMVGIEFSLGRVGPSDIKRLDGLLKTFAYRFLAMGNFASLIVGRLQVDNEEAMRHGDHSDEKPRKADSSKPLNDHSHSASRFNTVRREMTAAEDSAGHGLSTLLPILAEASGPLREGLAQSLGACKAFYDDANDSRWAAIPLLGKKARTDLPDVDALREDLAGRLARFREVERGTLVDGPFAGYFADVEREGKERDGVELGSGRGGLHASTRSLFGCYVFTTSLESCAESVVELLDVTASLQNKRTRNRLWLPVGLGKAWRKVFDSDGSSSTVIGGGGQVQERAEETRRAEEEAEVEMEADEQAAEADEGKSKRQSQPVGAHKSLARNPDASPPRTGLQRAGVKLSAVTRWLRSPKGLFSLRYAFVSLCLWIVAVHPTTARFNYQNRGLWALIMAQTSIGVYAGEQIAGFLLKMVGTLVGLVVGIVAWYIGAGGLGNGNAYGVAASTMVFVAPFLWARIVLPIEKATGYLMAGVTVLFIVGYSWQDTHLVVTVNSGVGVGLAWKRALLVIIGFTAGFIIMCFPRLTTARTLVRESACQITDEIAGIFVSEVEALLQEEAVARSTGLVQGQGDGGEKSSSVAADKARKERNLKRIGKRVLALVNQMQALQPSLTTARFEPQLQGPWPSKLYGDLLETQWRILTGLALLSSSLAKLEPQWCATLVHHSPFLNPDLITDILATLAVISTSLLSKRPLPPSVHSLRDRLVYHERTLRLGKAFANQPQKAPSESSGSSDADGESTLRSEPGTVDGASLGIDFTPEVARDSSFAIYATAVVSLSGILISFDRLTEITRMLVGESAKLTLLREWEGRGLALEEEGRRRRRALNTSSGTRTKHD